MYESLTLVPNRAYLLLFTNRIMLIKNLATNPNNFLIGYIFCGCWIEIANFQRRFSSKRLKSKWKKKWIRIRFKCVWYGFTINFKSIFTCVLTIYILVQRVLSARIGIFRKLCSFQIVENCAKRMMAHIFYTLKHIHR